MGRATLKQDKYLAGCDNPRARAIVVDALGDQVTLRIDLTDEVLGAIIKGKGKFFLASFTGQEWRDALERLS